MNRYRCCRHCFHNTTKKDHKLPCNMCIAKDAKVTMIHLDKE